MHCSHTWFFINLLKVEHRHTYSRTVLLYFCILYCLYWYTYHCCTLHFSSSPLFPSWCVSYTLVFAMLVAINGKLSKQNTTSTKTLPVALNSESFVSSLVSFPGSSKLFSCWEEPAWEWDYIMLLHVNYKSHTVITSALRGCSIHQPYCLLYRTLACSYKNNLVYIPLMLIVSYNNFQCFTILFSCGNNRVDVLRWRYVWYPCKEYSMLFGVYNFNSYYVYIFTSA